MRFELHAAAVLAPGMTSLAALRDASRRQQPPVRAPLDLPAPAALPPNERRRASQVVRLTLACIDQALQCSPFAADALRSVFATDEGTGEVCQQMLEAVTGSSRQVSPLLFPNSVHNAPSGYFSIALRNRQSATVISLGLDSFAAGLLCAVTEAASTAQPVLLVAYDPAMRAPTDEWLGVGEPTASAWILTAAEITTQRPTPALGIFEVELGPDDTRTASPLPAWLPASWAGHSSARALAALGLLEAAPGTVLQLQLGHLLLGLRRTHEGSPWH